MARETKAVRDVIDELKSEYGSMGECNRPLKQIQEMKLESATTNLKRGSVVGVISLRHYYETPYNDYGHGSRRFKVTLRDALRLAQVAPKFKPCFQEVAGELTARLSTDREAERAATALWCDRGLPTEHTTILMKPLQLGMRRQA